MQNGILGRIPDELILMIREAISEPDLQTHVCFLRSCSQIAALYGTEARWNAFFRHACWPPRMACMSGEDPDLVSWTDIAVDVITRDGFCTHPKCGGLLPENNGEDD